MEDQNNIFEGYGYRAVIPITKPPLTTFYMIDNNRAYILHFYR